MQPVWGRSEGCKLRTRVWRKEKPGSNLARTTVVGTTLDLTN